MFAYLDYNVFDYGLSLINFSCFPKIVDRKLIVRSKLRNVNKFKVTQNFLFKLFKNINDIYLQFFL